MAMIPMTCFCCGQTFLRAEGVHRRNVKTRGRQDRALCSRACVAKQNSIDFKQEDRFGMEALSARELQCARLTAQSMTQKEIARELKISPETVKIHMGNVYRKLRIEDRADLLSFFEDDAETQTPLTPRQIAFFDEMQDQPREMVRMTAIGFTFVDIAARVGVTHAAVKSRIDTIRGVVGARDRLALATLWNQYEKHKQEAGDERRRQHADHVSA